MFSLGAEEEETFINDATYYWQFYLTVLSHGTLAGWNPLWIPDTLKKIIQDSGGGGVDCGSRLRAEVSDGCELM